MCGIVGGISFDDFLFPSREGMARSMFIMRYRGPDFSNSTSIEGLNCVVHLGHTRLSIIDLSQEGNQPMHDYTSNNLITFNGEIYNYKEIRQELISLGINFNTNSDTEVILKAYSTWGLDVSLSKLDGMFAFALFDKNKEELVLARDKFGKKPLYFWRTEKKLMFSSDIRCFEKIDEINLTLNLHSLGYYFSELATPELFSIWNEIQKVRPGHYIKFNKQGLAQQSSYWNLNYSNDCKLNHQEIVEHTSFLLSKSVRKRLVADVRVAALLSGGIDSSLVVAKMTEEASGTINTYSVGFENQDFNELPFARVVADKFKTNHTELTVTYSSIDQINEIIFEFGEPFADSSMIPTYLISKIISGKEKVVLGGDGGDEFFSGYDSYYFAYRYDSFKRLAFLKPFIELLNNKMPTYRGKYLEAILEQTKKPIPSLLSRNLGFSDDSLFKLFPDKHFYESCFNEHSNIWNQFKQSDNSDLINVLSSSLHTRLVNDYLVKVDKASMYASLEMRSPFLDKDIAIFAASLKPKQLHSPFGPKSVLKSMASAYFPKSFFQRKKMGFSIPIGDWFRQEWKNLLREMVLGGKQNLVPLNYSFIEEIINEHEKGTVDHSNRIWALYVFHVWAQSK